MPLPTPETAERVATNGNHGDEDDLRGDPRVNAKQHVQAGCHLSDTETQRGRDTEHRAKHCQQIDRMADWAINSLTDHRDTARSAW